MKIYNSSYKCLIYYIKNIDINSKYINLLNKDDIRNLDIISNENNNNILSSSSISNVLSINLENLEGNDDNTLNQNQKASEKRK